MYIDLGGIEVNAVYAELRRNVEEVEKETKRGAEGETVPEALNRIDRAARCRSGRKRDGDIRID